MADNDGSGTATDPFTQLWTDWAARLGVGTDRSDRTGPAPAFQNDAFAKQMQRTFFDAMARYCDEFMRSEQFLSAMKQSMDQSLAFKKMMDDFLVKAHRTIQAPVRDDVDDLASLLRGIEERVFARLGRLEEKLEAMEAAGGRERGAKASRAPRPAARTVRPTKPPTGVRSKKTTRKGRSGRSAQ